MKQALEFDHEKETREILLSVLSGLERDERLLWGHRGFPHFGEYPCMVKIDPYAKGKSSPVYFIQLDTFLIYPMLFRHVIMDGIEIVKGTNPTTYRVERISPGKNDPIKNNFYCAGWREIVSYLHSVEQSLNNEVETIEKRHMEARQRLSAFRRRLPDFEEESGF